MKRRFPLRAADRSIDACFCGALASGRIAVGVPSLARDTQQTDLGTHDVIEEQKCGFECVSRDQWGPVNVWNTTRQAGEGKGVRFDPIGGSWFTNKANTERRCQSSKSSRGRLGRRGQFEVVFQVHEGPEAGDKAERWPEKLRRMARHFHLKPNELANRMIVAGMLALEREDPTTSRIL